MKFNHNFKLPQKSIFGFKVLSSVHSSIACYLLLTVEKTLNPFFGFSQIQIIAGCFFNILLNASVLILILNLFMKRKQIQKIYFVLLNSFLFFYVPFSMYSIIKNLKILFFLGEFDLNVI